MSRSLRQSHLDPDLTTRGMLREETKFTVLFVTHSIAEAIKIGNRILLLSPHPGRVKAEIADVNKVSGDGSAGRAQITTCSPAAI